MFKQAAFGQKGGDAAALPGHGGTSSSHRALSWTVCSPPASSSSWTVSAGHWLRQGWAWLPVPIPAGSCDSNQGLALWGQQPNRMGCGTGDLTPVGSKEQHAGHREDIGGAMRLPRPRGGG